jgi:hypothetical protein
MNKKEIIGGFFVPGQPFGLWVFDVLILIGFSLMISLFGYIKGRKEGNIEALTNNPSYELVTNPDSTKTWESIIKE